MSTPSTTSFVRDRFTWLAYLMLAYYAYLQAALGPLMPFLRDELGLNYTVGGLHSTAMAGGVVLAGLFSDRAVRRWERPRVFWGGGAGMALGALVLAFGHRAAITIAGAWLLGCLGSFLLATIQSSLADRHGPLRTIALTESNVGASVGAGLAPLLVGGMQRLGIGWRGALYVAVGVWALLFIRMRAERLPAAPHPAKPVRRSVGDPLPRAFWAYWVVILLSVAVEWSFVVWGADYMVEVGDLRNADASLLMTLFFGAMILGRYGGSRLSRYVDARRLLDLAGWLRLVGFLAFWIAPTGDVMVAGLFVAGLGVANFFPLLMAISVGLGRDLPDVASARVTLGSGLAILLGPQILGVVADQAGIQSAYGVVGVLLLAAMGMAVLADRVSRRDDGAQPAV